MSGNVAELTRRDQLVLLLHGGLSLDRARRACGLTLADAHRVAVEAGWPDPPSVLRTAAKIRAAHRGEQWMIDGAARAEREIAAMRRDIANTQQGRAAAS